MNLYQVSLLLFFLCFLTAFISATNHPPHFTNDDVSINCGSRGTSAAGSNREWFGDASPKFSSLLRIEGSSSTSSVVRKLTSDDDPVPHKTARLSRSRFSYSFHVSSGQKILRLRFNPAMYKGFQRFKDLFAVEAGPFTLLSNFSASFTADALGVNSFVKEYCINIKENQKLDIIFTPASSQSLDAYAFINGIEIISVPARLSYFHRGDIGVQEVGKSLVYVDNSTMLEIVRRLNVKQESFSSADDVGDMFGMWQTVPKRKASKINYITWKIPVEVGFRYLVRLHFSKVGVKLAKMGGIIFEVCINEKIVGSNTDMVGESSDENNFPLYRDFMAMMQGSKHEGKRDLLICLQSNDEFLDGQRPLKGFEIMKLSNPDYSLASPNPLPKAQEPSYKATQNFLQVLDRKNAIATVAVAMLALLNVIVYVLQQIREDSVTGEENKPSERAERFCRRFSLAEIQLATRNFSNAHLIGKGGFGKVYKGIIDNGRETVAIKRLKLDSNQGAREFLMEIETLTELRHVNLVSLIGYCNEKLEMILVYEYMSRGALSDHLYKLARNNDIGPSLTWEERLNICIGAGRGLDYLHTGHSLIHRDVKASNILLDESFTAKVSDFGLAKHLSMSKLESHVSTKVKGTVGYLDPDYLTTGKLTRKSDTYAFGVVLFGVLSGRRAVNRGVGEEQRVLTKWARENISKGTADEIVASNLRGEISEDSLMTFVGIAERCLDDDPKKRPTMAQVVLQLELALEKQENSKSQIPNRITTNDLVDDIKQSNGDNTNLSVSNGQLTMAFPEIQEIVPPPKEETTSKMVNVETESGRRDRRKAAIVHIQSWPWLGFWNRDNKQVKEAEAFNWGATKGIKEETLMESLPEDLQRDIRRRLLRDRVFRLLDESIIDAICVRLRIRTYMKGSKILYEGGLVDKMVCIIRGKMESTQGNTWNLALSEGDSCGEELLSWCLEHSYKDGKRIRIAGQRLLSNRSVTCVTNVEAFVLRAADLEEVASLYETFLRRPHIQRAIRYGSPYWRGLAARRIQVAWRYRKKRQSCADSSSPHI